MLWMFLYPRLARWTAVLSPNVPPPPTIRILDSFGRYASSELVILLLCCVARVSGQTSISSSVFQLYSLRSL